MSSLVGGIITGGISYIGNRVRRLWSDATGEPSKIDQNLGKSEFISRYSSESDLFRQGLEGSLANDNLEIIDRNWVMSRCMTPGTELSDVDNVNRRFTTTYWKFTNTSLGGNIGINPKPQYTRYADIRSASRSIAWYPTTVTHNTGNIGMGRYYSEAIDDNAQVVHFEFGVPKFASLLDFFSNAIDYRESVIANEGRSAFWYNLGELAGAGLIFVMFPQVSLMIWALKGAANFSGMFNPQIHRYYYLKPTMHTYWGAVNTLVTQMATELGILIPLEMKQPESAAKIGVGMEFDAADMREMAELYPGLIDPDTNYIDVFRIAARSQMMANRMLLAEYDHYKTQPNVTDFEGYIKTANTVKDGTVQNTFWGGTVANFGRWVSDLFGGPAENIYGSKAARNLNAEASEAKSKAPDNKNFIRYMANDEGTNQSGEMTPPYSARDNDGRLPIRDDRKADMEANRDFNDGMADTLMAYMKGGARFATFYVDYTGSVSDSFSNSTGAISSETGAKSIAQAGRNFHFMLGGGNIAAGLDNVVGAAKDVVSGALDSMSYGLSNILQTIFGGAYIDMPNKWEDSESSLANVSYSMTLISPYANPISQIQNIYLPLAMLMAGALPLGTGRSSYTSPFLCSVFDRGVQHIRLGMITSLSIERGTSNLAFSKTKRPLAMNVNFTVTNLSNALTVPMTASLFDAFKVTLDEDSPMGEYISTLCARSHLMATYSVLQWKLKLSRLTMRTEQVFNKDSWLMRTGEILNSLTLGTVQSLSQLQLSDRSATLPGL